MSELLDLWTYAHAFAGAVLAYSRVRFAGVFTLALGWEALEPHTGYFSDPSPANSLVDVVALVTAWFATKASVNAAARAA